MEKGCRKRRRGSTLSIVLVILLVASVLGLALMDRAIRGVRTAGWSRDHLVLRLAAESAAEEIFQKLIRSVNEPGTEPFRILRALPGGKSSTSLGSMDPPLLGRDLAELGRSLGVPVRVRTTVTLHRPTRVSRDPIERAGLVRIEGVALIERPGRDVVERIRVDRPFRIARVTPPRPLDQLGVFVAVATASPFANLPEGSPVYARARGESHTLLDLLTSGDDEGFRVVPDRLRRDVREAMSMLSPEALAQRAHYVVGSSRELGEFLTRRRRENRAIDGVIHCLGGETIEVGFPGFRGRCMISSLGQIKVKDISLADPLRDKLTLVSLQRIVVTGRDIEASLVNVTDLREGLVFANRARIRGSILTTRFPVGMRLSGQELGNCQIEYDPGLDSGEAPDEAPDSRLMSHYVAVFAPHPASVEHRRDAADWSRW